VRANDHKRHGWHGDEHHCHLDGQGNGVPPCPPGRQTALRHNNTSHDRGCVWPLQRVVATSEPRSMSGASQLAERLRLNRTRER
jgi:hypothetical protein